MLPFEFVIEGPPVSQQTRRRERLRRWIQEIRSIAGNYWPTGASPITGPIMFTITYFSDSGAIDVDNIPKPILDALKGLVYLDDNQVTDILCRKRVLGSNLHIESASEVLAEGFNSGSEFLYIVVEEALDLGVIYL